MMSENAKRKKEIESIEILNYFDNQAIREGEESRYDIDKFEIQNEIGECEFEPYKSPLLQQIEELEKLGLRKSRLPEIEPFILGTRKKNSSQNIDKKSKEGMLMSQNLPSHSLYGADLMKTNNDSLIQKGSLTDRSMALDSRNRIRERHTSLPPSGRQSFDDQFASYGTAHNLPYLSPTNNITPLRNTLSSYNFESFPSNISVTRSLTSTRPAPLDISSSVMSTSAERDCFQRSSYNKTFMEPYLLPSPRSIGYKSFRLRTPPHRRGFCGMSVKSKKLPREGGEWDEEERVKTERKKKYGEKEWKEEEEAKIREKAEREKNNRQMRKGTGKWAAKLFKEDEDIEMALKAAREKNKKVRKPRSEGYFMVIKDQLDEKKRNMLLKEEERKKEEYLKTREELRKKLDEHRLKVQAQSVVIGEPFGLKKMERIVSSVEKEGEEKDCLGKIRWSDDDDNDEDDDEANSCECLGSNSMGMQTKHNKTVLTHQPHSEMCDTLRQSYPSSTQRMKAYMDNSTAAPRVCTPVLSTNPVFSNSADYSSLYPPPSISPPLYKQTAQGSLKRGRPTPRNSQSATLSSLNQNSIDSTLLQSQLLGQVYPLSGTASPSISQSYYSSGVVSPSLPSVLVTDERLREEERKSKLKALNETKQLIGIRTVRTGSSQGKDRGRKIERRRGNDPDDASTIKDAVLSVSKALSSLTESLDISPTELLTQRSLAPSCPSYSLSGNALDATAREEQPSSFSSTWNTQKNKFLSSFSDTSRSSSQPRYASANSTRIPPLARSLSLSKTSQPSSSRSSLHKTQRSPADLCASPSALMSELDSTTQKIRQIEFLRSESKQRRERQLKYSGASASKV
ncbi:uncharacterized protein MONOS_5099 [Monocercomonoides exilis]|uniref:uncharacterized protein n=1 Tax=Monocercomonoides exilis TaxID=2049356 RepID=UPI0035599764|nr:hypothetical protein MONOS_5099 [Monocercomonoides exilis]